MANFTFLDNAEQLISDRTNVRLIDRINLDVDEGSVGSSVSHTFT